MKLPEPLEKLQEIKHATWIGLILTIVLNVTLMGITLYMEPVTGYYLLMVGLVVITFGVLYLFGWRDGKRLAVVGILTFILIGAVWGPMTVHRTYSMDEPEPVSSAALINWVTKDVTELDTGTYEGDGVLYAEDVGIYDTGVAIYVLDEGGLAPYTGQPGDTYNFTITLYSNESFTEQPEIMLAYALGVQGTIDTSKMLEVNSSDNEYADGKEFYYSAIINEVGIYSHVYSVNFHGAQSSSLNTTVALGPLVGDEADSYLFYAMIGIPSMFCNIGMLFIMLVLLYWWIGTAKEKRKSWDLDLAEKEAKQEEEMAGDDDESSDDSDDKPFTCDECGASVGVEDNFCPKCGERFDEVEDDEESEGAEAPSENEASEENSTEPKEPEAERVEE